MAKLSVGQQIANECRDLFDRRCMNISKKDYADAVEHLASIMEGYEDCIREEEQEAPHGTDAE